MKFARQLEDDAVPEWRSKYVDYKQGKKKIKAIVRAIRSVPSSQRPNKPSTPGSSLIDAPVFSLLKKQPKAKPASDTESGASNLRHVRTLSDSTGIAATKHHDANQHTHPIPIVNERSPLQSRQHLDPNQADEQTGMTSYGSIIGSPPHSPTLLQKHRTPPSLELPAPAVIDDDRAVEELPVSPGSEVPQGPPAFRPKAHAPASQLAHRGNAYEIRPPTDAPLASDIAPGSRLRVLTPKRTNSTPDGPFMRRMFSMAGGSSSMRQRDGADIALEAYKEVDFRNAEFFNFLDNQFSQVEGFYRDREKDAKGRMDVLREQLHRLRESRAGEIDAAQERERERFHEAAHGNVLHTVVQRKPPNDINPRHSSVLAWLTQPISRSMNRVTGIFDRHRPGHVGKTSRAMSTLGSPPLDGQHDDGWLPTDEQRDYVRRRREEVSYRVAKRKMKMALAEYYRGLELLKDYALVNRTAFRKITKKYTKRTGFPTKYMEEKVHKAHFVNSLEIEHLLEGTEDLYSRYFERGNKKIAISKLRTKSHHTTDHTGSTMRSGALLAAGTAFVIQGLVPAVEDLFDPPSDAYPTVRTSYLLQLYGGYFIILFLAFLFTACVAWFEKQKVNYAFIFELDRRGSLDWQQLVEIPSWFYFILGVFMYLNFALKAGGPTFYIWWPVVLVGLAVAMLFNPAPVFFYQQRWWLSKTLGRLFLFGFHAVEFRDLFIGDMLCSLTYSMGNIELFFCLYAQLWGDPQHCNSSNSRLLGFFSALPGIWRALHCIKRYSDDGSWWPNLVNFGKYVATILQYTTLSLHRINKGSTAYFALFIVCASINTIYCSFWDLVMDWSLGDSQHAGLRKTLVYQKHKWMYYLAMVIDPILRSNWIFYAIFAHDAQHSTIVSFMVALSEAARRGMWVLFRVENEQRQNIEKLRASKDLPLPYTLSTFDGDNETPESPVSPATPTDQPPAPADGTTKRFNRAGQVEQAAKQPSPMQTFLRRVGSEMRQAHTMDYQRRKPVEEEFADGNGGDDDDDDDSDDDP